MDLPRLTQTKPRSSQHRRKPAKGTGGMPVAKPDPIRKPAAQDLQSPVALVALGLDWLRQFECQALAALSGHDPECVHQMRVGLRRLRCLAGLLADLHAPGDDDALAAAAAEMRWIAGVLGRSRDLDVLVGEILPALAPGAAGPETAELRTRALRLQGAELVRTRAALAGARCTRLSQLMQAALCSLAEASPDLPHKRIVRCLVDSLDARAAKVTKRARRPRAASAAALHRLRIDVKKLRYLAEMIAPLCRPRPAAKYVAALSALQSRLGRLQDISRARAMIERMAQEPAASTLAAFSTTRNEAILARQQVEALEAAVAAARRFRPLAPFWRDGIRKCGHRQGRAASARAALADPR